MNNRVKNSYTEEYLKSIFSTPEKNFRSYASCRKKRAQASEDLRKAIEVSLKRLPIIQSKVITLRFWENYSTAEISRKIRRPWKETQEIYETALETLKSSILDGGTFYGKKANFTKPQFESKKVA